jgi:hypothetical protein
MEKLASGAIKFLLEFNRNAFFRSLAYGIVFSIIMTVVIGYMMNVFHAVSSFPFFAVVEQHRWVGILFVSFSLLFAISGYISDSWYREDIFSPLRRKLVGYWSVRAQSWMIEGGRVENSFTTSFCTIGIEDIGRKLIMHFEIRNSDVFRDQELDVTSITFGFQAEPKQLIYFHNVELALKQPIGQGSEQINQIKFPFMGILNIIIRQDKVDKMEGYWYDVDNTMYNLARRIPNLGGLTELTEKVEKGAVTFKGSLEFNRLPPPAG